MFKPHSYHLKPTQFPSVVLSSRTLDVSSFYLHPALHYECSPCDLTSSNFLTILIPGPSYIAALALGPSRTLTPNRCHSVCCTTTAKIAVASNATANRTVDCPEVRPAACLLSYPVRGFWSHLKASTVASNSSRPRLWPKPNPPPYLPPVNHSCARTSPVGPKYPRRSLHAQHLIHSRLVTYSSKQPSIGDFVLRLRCDTQIAVGLTRRASRVCTPLHWDGRSPCPFTRRLTKSRLQSMALAA